MTSMCIVCFVALLSISIYETAQVTEIRNVTLLLNQINWIPTCKLENRAQSPKLDTSCCDIKLKIRETINGVEMPSFRSQCDMENLKKIYRVGFHKTMKINKGDKMNLTIDVYDYDQHNYNPDRFLMTISAPVDLDKNDAIQYRACSTASKICGDVTDEFLPVTLTSNINEIITEVLHMQFRFTVQSNAVVNDAVLQEVEVSQNEPVLYEGTLKLNLISSKLVGGETYLFTISDKNDAGGQELVRNQFLLYKTWWPTFEAIYSEEFVSRSEFTNVTITIDNIIDKKEKKTVVAEHTFILHFKSIDDLHTIHRDQDSMDPFVYIQTRGISNRKIYGCKTYTAKFSIVSFNLFNGKVGDEGSDGDPWIRVTATSPTTGSRTIFENHFLEMSRAKMNKEDALLFTNGTLIGFPQNELNQVTINFLFTDDDSSRYHGYMPFFGIHNVGKYKMDDDLKDNVTMADFNSSSGGECVKYIPQDATKDDHDFCSLLLFEEEPCTTASTTTTTTTTTTSTPVTTNMVYPHHAIGLPSTDYLVRTVIYSNTTPNKSTRTEANAKTRLTGLPSTDYLVRTVIYSNTTPNESTTTEANAKTRLTGCILEPYLIVMVVLSVVMIPIAIYLSVRLYQLCRIFKSGPSDESDTLFENSNPCDNSKNTLPRSGSALTSSSMDSTMTPDTRSRTVSDSFEQAMTIQANTLSQKKYLRVTQTKRKSGTIMKKGKRTNSDTSYTITKDS